ncbi:hypothetical protein EW146_g7940 [Bondarzewia mesenterica]|uniref:Tethering factor for nuclear proteasome STS1 n=1 Tax=Bondarzewia mesenterica TaxID=1095465 RepID=A0A4S4LK54_9AGAM|nr:hypothetical protein EW146_g7940 [Bondarzewia mesenterica]
MANVIRPHPQLEFHTAPVNHAPSPFGFGFGLSPASMINWPTSGTHGAYAHPATLQQLASSITQPSSRALKRRHEQDDEQESGAVRLSHGARDVAMDRSPTPERPKRTVPKRARTTPASVEVKEGQNTKENKSPGSEDQVDVGVLLASLPSQSLLPLLNALLTSQPSLKPLILSLIPRPSLETAIQALAQCAKKLRDAYPYSNHANSSSSTSLGFGFGSSFNSRSTPFTSSSRPSSSTHPSGFSTPSSSDTHGGMREEYIVSRLRPHINEFVSACLSYLPYFSYVPSPTTSTPPREPSTVDLAPITAQGQVPPDRDPQLTQSSLVPMLLPRLLEEWKAWVDRVDEMVNKEGGMFGGETVRGWERDLDEFARAKGHGLEALREVRDQWVSRVGWLVGRMSPQMMEV